MSYRGIGFVAALATLTGCMATAPQVREPDRLRTVFAMAEHEAYAREGTATIKAQAFLRQRGGGVVTCAGSSAALLPHTEYFLESTWYAKERRQLEHSPEAKVHLPKIVRRTQCDAAGNFSFDRLPAGRYIVLTDVTWEVAGRRQGGAVMAAVEVADSSTATVIISEAIPLR
jgi:hypothetical protein